VNKPNSKRQSGTHFPNEKIIKLTRGRREVGVVDELLHINQVGTHSAMLAWKKKEQKTAKEGTTGEHTHTT